MYKNKVINIYKETYRERLLNYFNPYIYNFDGSKVFLNENVNMKSKSHQNRKKNSK